MLQLLKGLFRFSAKDSSAGHEVNGGNAINNMDRLSRACVRAAINHERSASVALSNTPTQQDRLAESPEAPQATLRPYGILVVDDEACVRGVLDAGMRQRGFAVWLAADGQEALDLYRRYYETIDVVLMDVHMPGLDGPQALTALQKLNPRIRCCFMSGNLGSYTEASLGSLGGTALIQKPFRPGEVAQALWELAGSADWTS